MDTNTACIILGVEKNASPKEIESSKRKLLQALHPDKHPPKQKEFFERRTRDVIEAAKILKSNGQATDGEEARVKSKKAEDPIARDTRIVKAIVDALNDPPVLTFTPDPRFVLMLRNMGESCCETDRAKKLLAGMTLNAPYKKLIQYLIKGWASP